MFHYLFRNTNLFDLLFINKKTNKFINAIKTIVIIIILIL